MTKHSTKMCKYWKWEKSHPKSSVLDNPKSKCDTCVECVRYQNYVADKISGILD